MDGNNRKLQKFYKYINNVDRTIKFTEEHLRNKIVFLDTTVTWNEVDTSETNVSQKVRDTHRYLHQIICISKILQIQHIVKTILYNLMNPLK